PTPFSPLRRWFTRLIHERILARRLAVCRCQWLSSWLECCHQSAQQPNSLRCLFAVCDHFRGISSCSLSRAVMIILDSGLHCLGLASCARANPTCLGYKKYLISVSFILIINPRSSQNASFSLTATGPTRIEEGHSVLLA